MTDTGQSYFKGYVHGRNVGLRAGILIGGGSMLLGIILRKIVDEYQIDVKSRKN